VWTREPTFGGCRLSPDSDPAGGGSDVLKCPDWIYSHGGLEFEPRAHGPEPYRWWSSGVRLAPISAC
jgi:hypothetical protein